MNKFFTVFLAALSIAAFSLSPAHAADGENPDLKAGFLKCNVDAGIGFIFGSSKDVTCTYEYNDRIERYSGEISKYGIDIGFTKSGVMVWAVLAATPDVEQGALRGEFIGVGADIAAGFGLGADVLIVGGDHPKFALQPLSIEGIEGLNIAAGISALELKPFGGVTSNRSYN